MSSNKSTRDRTKDRDRDRSVKKEKERKDRKSTRDKDREKEKEKEGSKNSRRLDSRDKHREKEESDRRRGEVRGEKREGERKKSSGRLQDKTERHREEAKSSRNKLPVESRHLIEDLIDDDGDLVESEISEENIKPPSRINQIQSAKIKEDKDPTENEDEYNYEDDDFEEYDEDFEEEDEEEEEEDDSEVSEEDENGTVEKKLDSGNYDMQTSRQSSLRMQRELEAVKEAMRRENSGVGSHTKRPPASADSGRQSGESPPSPARQERKQSGFINFSAAKERNKVQIAAAAATSRGSELLQMIRLDIVNFDLLDLPPIRY